MVWMAAPTSLDSGELASLWLAVQLVPANCSSIFKKSIGPNQSTTAWTQLDWSALPSSAPSSSATPQVVPSRETRFPPAEAPQAPNFSGLRLYFAALARKKRTEALASKIWAGYWASALKR